jgi:hypothetical protein
MENISKELMEAIKEQNRIGWQHLYYGQISQKVMDQHFQQHPLTNPNTQERDGRDN